MDQELFSNGLKIYSQQINNVDLLASLRQLQIFFPQQQLELKEWAEDILAVPLVVSVELPPLGNFENLDIRPEEPVIFVIDVKNYPNTAPKVFPDRRDFPKDRLAHLYIAKENLPPGFCLVRGNMDEWYADKQIKDLLTRTANWLRDAATGTLSEDGNQFEPLRLEGYNGSLLYDYDTLTQIVEQNRQFIEGCGFAVLQFERIATEDDYLSWKFIKEVTTENIEETIKEIFAETEKKDNAAAKRFLYLGYLLWSASHDTFETYDVHLPHNWASFETFCGKYGIDICSFKEEIIKIKPFRPYPSIPIVVAIKRPKTLIGFSGQIEFVNFHVRLPDENINENIIDAESRVVFKLHKQPITIQKAKEISGFSGHFEKVCLVAGCGALGSKISLHLAKAGNSNFILADPDRLFPHNFLRHGLSVKDVNINKAKALSTEINGIYGGLPDVVAALPIPLKADALISLGGEKQIYEWIFDFTASTVFHNKLSREIINSQTHICKGFITDFGNLGVLFFEGAGQNPRIDDLQVLLYTKALHIPFLSAWLNREAQAVEHSTQVTIGLGCNSETTVLSDDIVSLHAAVFSGAIKQESEKRDFGKGKVYCNQISYTPFYNNSLSRIEFEPLTVLNVTNDPTWQIRIAPGIVENLRGQMNAASPSETGGVFVGCANFKTKCIHVVEVIDAPPDSEADEICFYRGIAGLPEAITTINKSSGGQLGYIGEWHTHPNGPEGMSIVDMKAVRKFKLDFGELSTPLPVFLMILTDTQILTYVY